MCLSSLRKLEMKINNMKTNFFILALLIIFILSGFLFLRMLPTFYANIDNSIIYDLGSIVQAFAEKHNKLFFPQRYKNKIEQYMNNEIPNVTNKIDNIMKDFKNYHKDCQENPSAFLSKDEYCNKINEYEIELDTLQFHLYVDLSKITDEYLLIPIGNIPTDNSIPYDEILSSYFAKYKIDDSKLKTFNLYVYEQNNELNNCRKKMKCLI